SPAAETPSTPAAPVDGARMAATRARPTVSTPMTARSIKKRSNALFESDDGTDSLHGSTCVPSLVDLPSPLLGDLVPRPWDLGPCPSPRTGPNLATCTRIRPVTAG